MLRPIDAIFRHPVKKFTVIYQSGKLWQLPQLDFDGQSLQYKRPYTGSREQIFVAQHQQINPQDTLLRAKLATIALPATVVGANVDEFEHWWAKKSYDYRDKVAQSKAEQQQALDSLSQGSKPSTIATVATATTASAVTATPPASNAISPVPKSEPVSMPAPVATPVSVAPAPVSTSSVSSADDDLFDSMMADLTKDFR